MRKNVKLGTALVMVVVASLLLLQGQKKILSLYGQGSVRVFSVPKTLTVTPAVSTTTVGGAVKLQALVLYADGSSKDVTASARWQDGNRGISCIRGLCKGNKVGQYSVTARFKYITSSPVSVSVLDSSSVVRFANRYVRTSFPLPSGGPGNPLPLDIMVASDGTVWASAEFGQELFRIRPGGTVVEGLLIPTPSIFRWLKDGADAPTTISSLQESLDVDSSGTIWMTQGGWFDYTGSKLNASRVVAYSPQAHSWSCFNLPENNTQAIGVLVDQSVTPQRIWVAAYGVNKMLSFRPDTFLPADKSCDFDYSTPPPIQECVGTNEDRCFRAYKLPDAARHPAHMARNTNGLIWYSNWKGTSIGLLSPTSGSVSVFAFPPTTYPDVLTDSAVGSGLWQLRLGPTGKIFVTEFFNRGIGVFSPGCSSTTTLSRCFKEYFVPLTQKRALVHSIAPDKSGGAFFAASSDIWYLTPNGIMVSLPPPQPPMSDANGIALNHSNGELWVTRMFDKIIDRYKPQ